MNRANCLALAAMLLMAGAALSFAPLPAFADEDSGYVEVPKAPEPPPFCKLQEEPKKDQAQAAGATGTADVKNEVTDPKATPPHPKLVVTPELKMVCADGKVKLTISGRPYGWQVGDVIPLNFTFTVPEGVVINTDTLMQGKLALDTTFKQPFEMVGKPIIKTSKKDGGTEYDVTIQVRQFTITEHLRFTMQLPYAVEKAPDGSPKWLVFLTPEFVLLNSIDGGYTNMKRPMTMGNTETIQPRSAWIVPVYAIVLFLLAAAWPLMWLVRVVNRSRPRKSISREAAAWLAMHQAVKSGKQIGFGSTHYSRIGLTLRKYYGTVYPGLEGMTLTEIEDLPDDPQSILLKSVFRKLERVLVDERHLSAAELAQLLSEVDKLIKRPYTM